MNSRSLSVRFHDLVTKPYPTRWLVGVLSILLGSLSLPTTIVIINRWQAGNAEMAARLIVPDAVMISFLITGAALFLRLSWGYLVAAFAFLVLAVWSIYWRIHVGFFPTGLFNIWLIFMTYMAYLSYRGMKTGDPNA